MSIAFKNYTTPLPISQHIKRLTNVLEMFFYRIYGSLFRKTAPLLSEKWVIRVADVVRHTHHILNVNGDSDWIWTKSLCNQETYIPLGLFKHVRYISYRCYTKYRLPEGDVVKRQLKRCIATVIVTLINIYTIGRVSSNGIHLYAGRKPSAGHVHANIYDTV